MPKTTNLPQAPTGPTIYPSLKLPPVQQIPLAINPHTPVRAPSAPMISANGPASKPLGPMTNTVNQVR